MTETKLKEDIKESTVAKTARHHIQKAKDISHKVAHEYNKIGDDIENKELVMHLSDLMHLDIDAMEIYQEVIDNIKNDKNIHDTISSFKKDHAHHVSELGKQIHHIGGKTPERSADLKGMLLTSYTKLRGGIGGLVGYLKALHCAEEITNKCYKEAIKLNFSSKEMEQLINSNYEDEKKHIKYIEEQLKQLEK